MMIMVKQSKDDNNDDDVDENDKEDEKKEKSRKTQKILLGRKVEAIDTSFQLPKMVFDMGPDRKLRHVVNVPQKLISSKDAMCVLL